MRHLVAQLAKALTLWRPTPEPVCWCGIHHLGVGYVHERPSAAFFVPNVANPTAPTRAELEAGIRLDGIHDIRFTYLED